MRLHVFYYPVHRGWCGIATTYLLGKGEYEYYQLYSYRIHTEADAYEFLAAEAKAEFERVEIGEHQMGDI